MSFEKCFTEQGKTLVPFEAHKTLHPACAQRAHNRCAQACAQPLCTSLRNALCSAHTNVQTRQSCMIRHPLAKRTAACVAQPCTWLQKGLLPWRQGGAQCAQPRRTTAHNLAHNPPDFDLALGVVFQTTTLKLPEAPPEYTEIASGIKRPRDGTQ